MMIDLQEISAQSTDRMPKVQLVEPTASGSTCSTKGRTKSKRGAQKKNAVVSGLITQFVRLEKSANTSRWAAAKIAHELVKVHKLTRATVAKRTGHTGQRIGQYVGAVETANRLKQETNTDYTQSTNIDAVIETNRAFNKLNPDEQSEFSLRRVLDLVADGASIRQITSSAAAEARRARIVRARETATTKSNQSWKKNCYSGDCRDFVQTLNDQSVQLFHFDPPYCSYSRQKDGGYRSGRSSTSPNISACANNDHRAIAMTCEVIKLCEPKLADNGVIVLWQAGSKPLRVPVQLAIEEAGLEVAYELTLDKTRDENSGGSCKPGRFSDPYSISSEKAIIITRRDQLLQRKDHNLPRGDIIKGSFIRAAVKLFEEEHGRTFYSWGSEFGEYKSSMPSKQSSAKYAAGKIGIGDVHEFQKPEEISLFLLLKHADPNDLVVDLCGCSASFCIAADQVGCRWHYCEMPTAVDEHGNQLADSGNYDFGVSRLANYFESKCKQNLTEKEGVNAA